MQSMMCSRLFRSTSLREARLGVICDPVVLLEFRSTSLREARLHNEYRDYCRMLFRSTSLREARLYGSIYIKR